MSLDYRTETIHHVKSAVSTNNKFAGITLPQNPGMATNNFNSGHQDSYCSESVGLTGPTSNTLKLIKQFNPFGFVSIQACNSNNQMIAASFFEEFFLIVYDSDCHIISATPYARLSGRTFAGGYFYLNADDDSVVCTTSQLQCYPTAYVPKQSRVYPLKPKWISDDIVKLVTGQSDSNILYTALPVWGQTNLYWCLLAGKSDGTNPAYMAVVKISPDTSKHGCETTLIDSKPFCDQWNNNSFAVDEDGAYFVLNALTPSAQPASYGSLICCTYDSSTNKISQKWSYQYKSCGYLKTGQTNIGSGTTPTLTVDNSGAKCVSITDNAAPRMNVVVVNRDTGDLISETPVFSKMRSADEASLIGVKDKIIVENNFGHTLDYPFSQLVSNEPGMNLITVNPSDTSAEIVWDNSYTTFFGMSMLARESGIIFSFSGSWYETESSTSGPEYSVIAIDSFDGRIIWRIPIGRGLKYCHEYGGIYFNYSGTSLYVGTNLYLISIQDVAEDDSKALMKAMTSQN